MKLRMRTMEGQELSGTYPEPWWVGKSLFWIMLYRGVLTGRPMDNVIRTNATYFRSASSGYPSRWLRLAGWQRSMLRVSGAWSVLMLMALTLTALTAHYMLTAQLLTAQLMVLTLPALLMDHYFRKEHGLRLPMLVREEKDEDAPESESLGALTWRMVWLLPGRAVWERELVQPLAIALTPLIGVEHRPDEARRWVTVPRNYMEPGGQPVEILLPRSFHGADPKTLQRIERAAASRLSMLEVSAHWQLSGAHPRLLLSAPPAPPEKALFAQFEHMLMSTQEYRPFLGVVSSGELLSAEMINDSPHIALSAGSGAGKSMMMKVIIMQALRWGWGVIILDWKAASHTWAKGLPGVTYVSTTEGIHDMGVRLGEEVDIRKVAGLEGRAKILVVREEWNMTASLLMDFWQALRSTGEPEERRGMPTKSPALQGFGSLVFAGRQFGMFDLLAAQRMSNRVFNGNVDMRENYMIRLLARYTPQTVKMLCPDIKPFPRKPKELGRWVVVANDDATLVQGILTSDEEARSFAIGGVDNPTTPLSSSYHVELSERGNVGTMQGEELPPEVARALVASPVKPMKLSALVEGLEHLGVTYKVLDNSRQRDPQFPKEVGGNPTTGWLYAPAEVADWAAKRAARMTAERMMKGNG